jgi:hypothetical protein
VRRLAPGAQSPSRGCKMVGEANLNQPGDQP